MKSDVFAVSSILAMILITCFIFYVGVAWSVFQIRNPIAAQGAFFRNFVQVIEMKKLPEYQPRK